MPNNVQVVPHLVFPPKFGTSAGPYSPLCLAGLHSACPRLAGPHPAGPCPAGQCTAAGPCSAGPHSAGPCLAGPCSAVPYLAGLRTAGLYSVAPCFVLHRDFSHPAPVSDSQSLHSKHKPESTVIAFLWGESVN
jgi:hypothetical protein